jgi:ATP-dependent DNA ligase
VPYSALPEPLLAKSGKLPTRGDWSFEVKWDGFRAIVSTDEGRCACAAGAAGT